MSEEQDPQDTSSDVSDSESDPESTSPGPSQAKKNLVPNPFYKANKRAKVDKNDSDSDISDSDSDGSDSDPDSDLKPEPEVDEEDPLIKALKKAKEKAQRKSPMDVKEKEMIMDLSFHPEMNLLAHATINGRIATTRFSNEENVLVNKAKCHKETVRSLEFSCDGSSLISGTVFKRHTGQQDRALATEPLSRLSRSRD